MNAVVSQALSVAIPWQAQWIGRSGVTHNNWQAKILPAPLLRRELVVDGVVKHAHIHVCGLGYYELRMNGGKVGDHVLEPTVSQYDERVRYVTHDVSRQLRQGGNALGVMLGNGWYNCHTADVWHFDKASWRDYPKLILQLEIAYEDGREEILVSDANWRVAEGPIRFDGLRNGETYDARLEPVGWDLPDFNDDTWQRATIVAGPGGLLEPQTAPPCKVIETLSPRSVSEVRPGVFIFDLGQNMAGWAQLKVRGPAGTEVVLRYAEKLKEDGDIDQSNINSFIKSGDCQTDRYICKGDGEEIWEPHFTYHGFQYVQVTGFPGVPTLDSLRGQVVHTAFEHIGRFECSDPLVNRLQECTLWAYRGNFVGIPTDCPHREKNGWTGDAQLAVETGLCNFSAGEAYREWLQTLVDTQRPNGQLPGIVPSTGWGFNWGSGPAWDSALILIPWYVYLYTGDTTLMEENYEAMQQYIDFCGTMATDHIVSFGLGDWCHVERERMAPAALTSTGYYYRDVCVLAEFAEQTGRSEDVSTYRALAAKIKDAFNARFYKGDGIYANGEQTALACALYQDLVEESEKGVVVAQLVKAVEAQKCHADFGILGAQYIPRVLADNGHVGLAYRILTQPEFPGWIHWLNQGATTLWESWHGGSSLNHIMFGDISAWMYKYLAGIAPDEAYPGFSGVTLCPSPVADLDWVKASHLSPEGLIRSEWRRVAGAIEYTVEIPDGVPGIVMLCAASVASVSMPDLSGMQAEMVSGCLQVCCPSGTHVFTVNAE